MIRCAKAVAKFKLAIDEGRIKPTNGDLEYAKRVARSLRAYQRGDMEECRKWILLAWRPK